MSLTPFTERSTPLVLLGTTSALLLTACNPNPGVLPRLAPEGGPNCDGVTFTLAETEAAVGHALEDLLAPHTWTVPAAQAVLAAWTDEARPPGVGHTTVEVRITPDPDTVRLSQTSPVGPPPRRAPCKPTVSMGGVASVEAPELGLFFEGELQMYNEYDEVDRLTATVWDPDHAGPTPYDGPAPVGGQNPELYATLSPSRDLSALAAGEIGGRYPVPDPANPDTTSVMLPYLFASW